MSYEKSPLLSIVLPVYNGEKYLATSIESCINQTFKDWELLIVDDGSTDKSAEIAKKYEEADSRIHYYKNEKNMRLPRTLNRGFSLAKGSYLTWTSHDNYYRPQALEKMLNALQETKAELVFTVCSIINENDEEISVTTIPKDCQNAIWRRNPVGACFMYTRKVYESIGDYDPDVFLCEDYDYWLRIFAKFPITYLEENLYVYRMHDKSLTATHTKGQYDAVEKVLLKNFKMLENPTKKDLFYYYWGLHRSRRLQKSWKDRLQYLPKLLFYLIWHKF